MSSLAPNLKRLAPVAICLSTAVSASCSQRNSGVAPLSKQEQHLEALIFEAATFFEVDPHANRVSEAKAISDLLTVAETPDAGMIARSADRCENSIGRGQVMYALNSLADLTFTFSNSDPEMAALTSVNVRRGRLQMVRPDARVFEYGGDHFGFDFKNSNKMPRRLLRPFLGQIMTLAQFKADKRTHGELNPSPSGLKPDPTLMSKLLLLLEDARTNFHGASGDNRKVVSDLVRVALTSDVAAIRGAGSELVKQHLKEEQRFREDKTASVLDPLLQLMWGASKYNKVYDCKLDNWIVKNGILAWNPNFIHLGDDNRDWPNMIDTAACYWKRRDLSGFVKQASPMP